MISQSQLDKMVDEAIANQPSRAEVDKLIQAEPLKNPKTYEQLSAENPQDKGGLAQLAQWEKMGFH